MIRSLKRAWEYVRDEVYAPVTGELYSSPGHEPPPPPMVHTKEPDGSVIVRRKGRAL